MRQEYSEKNLSLKEKINKFGERKLESGKRPDFKVGITHSKTFHADDVFSTALLKLLCPDIKIMRKSFVKDVVEDDSVVVYDIGGGKYDHHGIDKETRKDGTPYSSFGKLWRDFGIYLVGSQYAANYIDNILVRPIDITDNGGAPNPLTSAIKAFNPCWNEDDEGEKCFDDAVEMAMRIINNHVKRKLSELKADEIIDEALRVQRGGVIILDKYIPVKPNVREDVKYVIYPSGSDTWVLDCVMDATTHRARKPFPATWNSNPPVGIISRPAYEKANASFRLFNNHKDALNAGIEAVNYKGGSLVKPSFTSATTPKPTYSTKMKGYIETLANNDNMIYDDDTKEIIEAYGLFEIDKTNEYGTNEICAILSTDRLYSVIPLNMNYDKSVGRLVMSDINLGVVDGSKSLTGELSNCKLISEYRVPKESKYNSTPIKMVGNIR